MTRRPLAAALLLCSAAAVACGDSPTTPTVPLAPPAGLQPRLSSIQREIFNLSCIGHHGDSRTDAGLDLRNGRSYSNLVNVRSQQAPIDRVEPRDPNNSYLIHKLEGRAGIAGERMPTNGPYLSIAQIDVIRQWIQNGAQNN